MTSLISQTNYFYLDLDKNIANGCSEFIVENRSELKLFIGNLKIQEILCNGDVADCQFSTEEHKCSSSDNSGSNTTNSLTQSQPYQRFDKRQSKYSQILDKRKIVKIWTRMGKNTIVIKFKPNLTFYSQMDQFDDHKEVIGAMNKQVFFPFLDEMTNLKLIYVVNPDLTVLSSGQMENVIEQDEFAIHTFLTITFPRNIAFCVGKFEKFELSSSKILFLPKYQDYSEIKHEILSTQKIMNHYSINDKSLQIHLIFPYSDIETDAENLIIKPFGNFPFKQDIEQNFRFRQNIGISMASQLFMKIEFKKEDLWLKTGLIGYIGNQIAKNSLGTNEFLYQLKIDINQVVSEDKEHLPLFSFSRSIESCQTEFFMKKSQIFFQILENVTSFSSLQKIIKSILTQSTISTESFINIVKDSTGRDLSHEKQIFKNSATLFTGDLSIDQKKNTVKVVFNKPVNTLIQSNELEGVFEYPIKKEVTYTYHNRRKREEESVLFIKIDPYITQINNFKIILKNTMYNFLTKDKNILSQLEGVQHVDEVELERIIYDHNVNYHIRLLAMNYLGINSIFSFFVKKFCIPGSTIIKPNSFTILNHFLLIGLINTLSFSNPHTTREIVTNNSIKSEQTPIQDVKNTDQKRTVTHGAIIKAFYHNILRYNDNSSNQYSDGTFVSSIIRNFSFMFVSYTDETFNEFIEQNDLYFEIIERYRRKDLIFPSFGNQITCSVLYFYGKLDLYGIIELDFDYLHFLLQETNYIDIRCCAAEILTFKNICDESSECPEQLINLLSLDDKIIETVLQTLLNMLETDF
ncbi:TATA binding protein associated factor, partial [Pseudoloma neurophilia]